MAFVPLSFPLDPSEEISAWLSSLHLPQYASNFTQAGYCTLGDCRGLTEEKLLNMGYFPTGHRRRILRSLEVFMGGEGSDERKPVPLPRSIFLKDGKRVVRCQFSQKSSTAENKILSGTRSLPARTCEEMVTNNDSGGPITKLSMAVPHTLPRRLPKAASSGSSSTSLHSSAESLSLSSHSAPSDWENSEEPASSIAGHIPGVKGDFPSEESLEAFQGEMVDNDIYESSYTVKSTGPRKTYSYRLRHRPVPEIPERTIIPSHEWSVCAKTSTEQQSGTEAPSGPTGRQKDTVSCFRLSSGGRGMREREECSDRNKDEAPLQRTLSPITPYGELYLYNKDSAENKLDMGAENVFRQEAKEKLKQKKSRKHHTRQKEKVTESINRPDFSLQGNTVVSDDGYSLIQPSLQSQDVAIESSSNTAMSPKLLPQTQPPAKPPPQNPWPLAGVHHVSAIYSEPVDTLSGLVKRTLPAHSEMTISPYACFYGGPHSSVKMGWLDKLSPQGNCVFQRRWVKFDGENLTYYNNDKEMYSKGLVPLSAVRLVRSVGDNKLEVVTSQRTFVFRAEKEGERQDWLEVLQSALKSRSAISHKPCKHSSSKSGSVELRGHKGKVYLSLTGTKVRLCKTEQDFNSGVAIAVVDLTAACVKHVDRRSFEINTPFRSFCFTAESEHEREEWIEAVQESIVETLSNYEVAEKVWFNQSNRNCADCKARNPEWASINLGVVICKTCAGQHRFLGCSISQVRSLKLDSTIWTNELVELFLAVGNENANSFWAANLPPEEELHMGATPEQRATFHRRKYRERKYRRILEGLYRQEELNQALCSAVLQSDVLVTMALVFSGADVMCTTGDPDYSTPYLLAQKAGQRLQMEFLYHNQLSEFAKLEMVGDSSFPVDASSFMDGFLYCSVNMLKSTLDRKGRDDMVRRWCTLEGGYLSYYESEKSATAIGRVDIKEVVSLAISNTETMTGAGAVFTFEIYLQSEKAVMFGAETSDTQRDWAHAITKCFLPLSVESLLKKDCELVGRLYYKEGHDLYHWRKGWFSLIGCELFFCPEDEHVTEGLLQLKRLQELTVSTHLEGEESVQVLLMVESGRTIYIHGFAKQDFALWHSAIQLAAGRDGRALSNQQLSKNDVPIIVDSCVAFVTQYGLCYQGIYQKNGDPKRVAQLLEEFTQDARNVKLRIQDHRLEDVTDTLKRFLSQCEDALLAKELYPYWISTLDEENEKDRIEKYSTYIQSLPKISRSTLAALLQHLYRIQSCSHINQMKAQSLACVFSSCLFQTEGHTPQETRVVEDLISNYAQLFSVNEEQVRQMERENCFITRWKDTTFSPAGDLIFEVYLEKKEPENCCLIKVSPTMSSDELAESTLELKGIEADLQELWTTFEVIENGELERPLHYKEKVLEQVLEWNNLEDPSSAFVLIRTFPVFKMSHCSSEGPMDVTKAEQLKFKDGSTKLLSVHKFQDRYLVLRDKKLLLYKDSKSTKPEREVPVESVKCYLGLRKKLKPASSWCFTVYTQKQQWYFCCERKDSQLDWVISIIRSKHGGDLWPKFRNRNKHSVQQSSREHAFTHQGLENATRRQSKEDNRMMSRNVTFKTENSDEADKYKIAGLESHLKYKDLKGDSRVCSSGGNYPLPRDRMACDGPPQIQHVPSHPDMGNHTKPPQKKAMFGHTPGQMPQNLLNELNTVLNQAGRIHKEES
ncbi:arf-GAP with Rho-GAP domain, ANK repeat and PH domain-containing protein 2 isoform X1 [Pygocentrus nattereri]|uniref:ArfGAP with RhoGAP domain, ankyrin repeat and PH domain 2 n=1 Tax=Pygocentrus nattereri TaxID=42514 RepID=A0A3B4BZH0_PYGNA|nr:arf-GAP with Rho-GAP domain, ANK repeat and PH domain-containing protein 2 isoform X1 [Pygocentrus nattereri]XP_017555123.1 arf-GAP with Rho-GAP domain, ANK repeat and PH domain-containing protein 2 isoform X1 [Pygocentrus nattereri]